MQGLTVGIDSPLASPSGAQPTLAGGVTAAAAAASASAAAAAGGSGDAPAAAAAAIGAASSVSDVLPSAMMMDVNELTLASKEKGYFGSGCQWTEFELD